MERDGRIIEHDLAKYNTANVVFEPAGMAVGELYEGYLWMYKQFYSFGNILRRMPISRNQKAPYLLFNVIYRKFGRSTSVSARLIPIGVLGRLSSWLSYHTK